MLPIGSTVGVGERVELGVGPDDPEVGVDDRDAVGDRVEDLVGLDQDARPADRRELRGVDVDPGELLLAEQDQGAGHRPGRDDLVTIGQVLARRRPGVGVAFDDQESRLLRHTCRPRPDAVRSARPSGRLGPAHRRRPILPPITRSRQANHSSHGTRSEARFRHPSARCSGAARPLPVTTPLPAPGGQANFFAGRAGRPASAREQGRTGLSPSAGEEFRGQFPIFWITNRPLRRITREILRIYTVDASERVRSFGHSAVMLVTMRSSSAREGEFAEDLRRHQTQIFGFIYSLVRNFDDADDLFQQTSLVLWKKYDRYDPSKSFVAWACGVARFEVAEFPAGPDPAAAALQRRARATCWSTPTPSSSGDERSRSGGVPSPSA